MAPREQTIDVIRYTVGKNGIKKYPTWTFTRFFDDEPYKFVGNVWLYTIVYNIKQNRFELYRGKARIPWHRIHAEVLKLMPSGQVVCI